MNRFGTLSRWIAAGFKCARATAVLVLIIATGCGEGDPAPDGDATVVRDSAGVRIVENGAPVWGEGDEWQLAAEPSLEIGLAGGAAEYLFSGVSDVLRLHDGRILVINRGPAEVRLFDAEGEFVRSIGGEGDGPGEFRLPGWMRVLSGDTLLVYDLQANRLSRFELGGDFLNSVNLEPAGAGGLPQAVGALADGSMLVQIRRFSFSDQPVEVRRDSVYFIHFSAEGTPLDTLALLPGTEMTTSDAGGVVIGMPVFFGRSAISVVGDDRIYLGTNDTFEIRVFGKDGGLERIIRSLVPLRPIPPGAREEKKLAFADEEEPLRSALTAAAEAMPEYETLPAFARFLSDAEGNLWVEEPQSAANVLGGWIVFDPQGRMLGTVVMPAAFRPRQIGSDFVIGVGRDELEIERVRMYALEKP